MSHSTTAFTEGKCRRLKILCILETGGQAVLTYTLQSGLSGKFPTDTLDNYLKKLPRDSTSRFMGLVKKKLETEKKNLESEKQKLESVKKNLNSEEKKMEFQEKIKKLEEKIKESEKTMKSDSPYINEVCQKIIEGQFNKTDMKQIEKYPSCTKFDITLLHKAIKQACEGIEVDDNKWKTRTTPQTLEYLVTQIKEERNNIVHEDVHLTQQEYEDKVKTLKALFTETLKATGMRYNRDLNEVTAKNTEVMQAVGLIISEPLSLEDILQRLPHHLLSFFKQEAVSEIKKRLDSAQCLSPLEFLNGKEDFRLKVHSVFSRIAVKDEKQSPEHAEKTVSHNEFILLTQRRVSSPSPQLLLVEGDAGSGKTTLLTFILAEWLKDEPQRQMEGLQDFDLIFWVVCREHTSETLQSLVEKVLPDSFILFQRLLIPLVKGCKVLILIDGLDEMTSKSHTLLKDILSEMENCPMTTIICTSRSEGVKGMKAMTPIQFQLTHTKIMGIPLKERIGFVENYFLWLCKDKSVNTDNLRQRTQQTINNDIFCLPLNLVFLAQIFSENPHKIYEEITETQLYTTIVDWCTDKLQHRLEAEGEILHIKYKVKRVLTVMYRVALDELLENSLFLSENSIQKISSSCKEESLPEMVEKMVFSAFLSLRCGNYSFPHKSMQEYFAAQHVISSIDTYEDGAIRRVLEGRISQNVAPLRNMLLHILGLLCRQQSPAVKEMEETVDLLHESGVNEIDQWLTLLADKEVDQRILERVAHHIKEDRYNFRNQVTIRDGTVRIAALLLPLLSNKTIKIDFERDPTQDDVQQIIKAVTPHKVEEVYLYHHYQHPDAACPSAHILQQIHTDDMIWFVGHLGAEHLSLLPRGLVWLWVSVASGDHAERLIPSLASLREHCPRLGWLNVHLPLSVIASPPSTSLPGGGVRDGVSLYLSDMDEGRVGLASDIIAAVSPSDHTGYGTLSFPRASVSVHEWRRLIENLASRKVKVRGAVSVPSHTLTEDEGKQLRSLTRSLLGCRFVWEDFIEWQ